MKKHKKTITITPSGSSQPCLTEASRPGEARVAINVRECGESLRVTGNPVVVDNITAGHRLLLVDSDRRLTLHGRQVMSGQQVVATLDGDLVGAHRVGQIVVIASTAGLHWLVRTDDGYSPVSLSDACPTITLSALEWDNVSAAMPAVTFDTPYTQWPTTLSTSDVSRLSVLLRQAWGSLQQTIDAAGSYSGTMLVRCGVRLYDDSYLWLGDPVTIGAETQLDAAPIQAECELDGTQPTGIPSTTLTRRRYRLGITVTGGIAQAWLPLVKSVDILGTSCASAVVPSGMAQYRCIGVGGSVRRPRLEFGLPAVSADTISSQLSQSGWHVIATTSDLAALNEHHWNSDAVVPSSQTVVSGLTSYVTIRTIEEADRLSAQQAEDVTRASTPLMPIASLTINGRLYCIDADGMLAVSAPGNPLVTARQQAITGVEVRAMMPLSRSIYSGGFGRYPIVLFTDEGIYALGQTHAGASFGEPRLLDRTVIAPGSHPIEGHRDLYFCDRQGHLCRLRGSEVSQVWRDTGLCQLAWDVAHRELWCRRSDGSMLAVMSSGRASERTVIASQLYNDGTHALAIDNEGVVMDLTQECDSTSQPFEWQSHPLLMNAPTEVVWQVLGNGTFTLALTGERGISCHGFVVGRLRVSGAVNAPLRQLLVSPPLRTIRLHAFGTVHSGTCLLKSLMSHH